MSKQILTQEQIDTIENENLNEYFWLFQLGVGAKEGFNNTDNDFSFNFYEKGKQIWAKCEPILKDILCDKEKKIIKPTIDEGVLGNGRELIFFLYSVLTENHNIVAGISIPLISIVLKYKLQEFCSG